MAESTSVDSSIISKITIASIGCKPGLVAVLEEGQNELPLARLYGTLDQVREYHDIASGRVDPYFVGSFEAINLQTGEVFKSGKMYLPKGLSEMVESAVKKNPDAAIQFAFEVRSIKASNAAKYSYKALALVSPEPSDALRQLREAVLKAGAIDVKRLTPGQRGQTTTIEAGHNQKKSA